MAPGAMASMVCGIVAIPTMFIWLLGLVPAIIAIVLGNRALATIRSTPGAYDGESQAKIGRLLGYLALALVGVTA
ncbi:MAG TPA: DUF4190 domain-containing protein, partial [Candidatus Thermoplasmatota archaeon]|nr:DUF4190 domain-containing protein [Candidatus Thermoplasmatota archaeon]